MKIISRLGKQCFEDISISHDFILSSCTERNLSYLASWSNQKKMRYMNSAKNASFLLIFCFYTKSPESSIVQFHLLAYVIKSFLWMP